MHLFPNLAVDSAPARSQPALQTLQSIFGFIPNVASAMAHSPVLITSLVGLFQNVHGGNFSEKQIQVLLLTNAVTNACPWAVAFHSSLALKEGVSADDVQAMRLGQSPHEPALAALSTLARNLIGKRGRLHEHDADAFLQAGFSKELLLEVIAVVAASTITNYTANVTDPPLEAAFQAHAWSK